MLHLTEDLTKQWLRASGLPVPQGLAVASPHQAREAAERMPRGAVVKALVPMGRRGKAGAVLPVDDAAEASGAAAKLLGSVVNGHLVQRVYVEQRIDVKHEYYVSFVLRDDRPEVLISRSGGVDIEEVARVTPELLVRARVDPLRGLDSWTAADLWLDAGVHGASLPRIAALTAKLYQAFCHADALLLEINPLAIDASGEAHVVGAMMAIDPDALFRHAEWRDATEPLAQNPREHAVALANRQYPGGECQYVELEGDIGLLVGGGGAGLYQHDLMLEAGGRPANHCVTPPTGSDNRKLKAVLGAILDNPGLRGLLIGFNFAQMARTDIRVRTLVELLDEKQIDTARLPIVIRLFGAGEKESRAMVEGRQNIHYVPRGTTLREAVRLIVQLVAKNTGDRR
jgi:succinyl-CoA synthetase beta subunit/citryl-CoA synthetase large subunit